MSSPTDVPAVSPWEKCPARLTVLQEWLEGRAKGELHTGKDYRCKRGGACSR